MSAMQSLSHSFFDKCSITTARGHNDCGASAKKPVRNSILKAFDVDLEGVDLGHASFLENALQPQGTHLDGTAGRFARYDMAGAEIVAVGLDHQLAVARTGSRANKTHLAEAGRSAVEAEPRMGDRVRLDRDHLAGSTDMARQHQRVGADIGAGIDEHTAHRHVRTQKLKLFRIVIGIEQGAALGRARLMIEAEGGALILHVDRTGAQQVDQPRQHRPERAALQRRALRKADDRGLRGIRFERPERRWRWIVVGDQALSPWIKSGACIAGFADASNRCRRCKGRRGRVRAMSVTSPVSPSAVAQFCAIRAAARSNRAFAEARSRGCACHDSAWLQPLVSTIARPNLRRRTRV